MDLIDLIVVLIIMAMAISGFRTGGLSLFLSYVGFFFGIGLGVFLGTVFSTPISNLIHNSVLRLFLGLALIFFPASILSGVGHLIGERLSKPLRNLHLGVVDGIFGIIVAIIATLFTVWVLSAVLANSPFIALNAQIQKSAVLRGLDKNLPQIPLNEFRRLLVSTGFPPAFTNFYPINQSPVAEATSQEVNQLALKVSRSIVKIEGAACGGVLEGTGFVISPNTVLTNAHVVAGVNFPTVTDFLGTYRSQVIYFNPNYDLALLRVYGLPDAPLTLSNNLYYHGTQTVFIGYPGGGPLNAQPSGILDEFNATGPNIYFSQQVTRPVYELEGNVEPGNSGGPLFNLSGDVIGVIFSKSTTSTNIGYALASPWIISSIENYINSKTVITNTQCAS